MSYDNDNINTPGPEGDYEELLDKVKDAGNKLDNESLFNEEDSPIDGLKAVVMSIEWEITDQTMLEFDGEIEKLKEMWANEKAPLAFLKILGAIGEYIKAAKIFAP